MQMQLGTLLDVLAVSAKLGALAGALLLYGCGNPAEDAAAAAREAATEWQQAAGESDPNARLEIYRSVVADVEAIAADYAETPTGQAIAGGRSIGFLSLADMRAVRDDFAARAPCYADPSVECLTAFASRAFQGPAGDDSLIRINQIVCERGFAPAAAAIEHLKINKPEYAAQLWNIAYQAASCGNDAAVEAAIAAYVPANPAVGAERVNDLLQIVATEGVEAGWPAALRELESNLAAAGLDENTRATAALTMAVAYAGLGDARSAVAKYTYFTDTLGYAADLDSRRGLAARLILAGAANLGLPIARDTQGAGYAADALAIWATHAAATILGRRAGVIEDSSYLPNVILVDDVRDVLGPVEAAEAARHSSAAATVEGVLDSLAPAATVQNLGIGNPGLDGAYLILALVQQKAGDAAKANATLGKVEALRGRLLDNPGLQARGLNERAVVRTYVALAQGKAEEAVGYAQDVGMKNYIGRPIALELARQGDAERALTVAGQFGVDLRSFQLAQPLVQALIEAGETEKADQVIAALPMDANVRGAFYWDMVAKAAADGDQDDAEEIATEHSLLNTPADRLRLLTLFLNAEDVATDRGDAEPIIREIFTIGRQLEAGSDRLIAQEAARQAFANGHTELGIELYRSAERKDQTPLFAAFRDGLRRRDLTAILMLAHDNLSGETRAYVIDAAIRHLNGNG